MDTLTTQQQSGRMLRVRFRDTKPEYKLRDQLALQDRVREFHDA